MDPSSGHVVLCGLNELGYRTLEGLRRMGERVVVITRSSEHRFTQAAHALGAALIVGSPREESVLRAAGITSASALLLTEDDDIGNLHAALAAQDLNPRLRIGLRLFDQELGQQVPRLFYDCCILDPATVAAPAFVSAALHQDRQQQLELAGRFLGVRRISTKAPGVLLPLARTRSNGSAEIFPTDGDNVLCLVDRTPIRPWKDGNASRERKRPRVPLRNKLASAWAVVASADRRLRYLVATLVGMAVLSVLVFRMFAGLDVIDALYFTVTIITTTGFGDISLRDAPTGLQLYVVTLMLLGAATLAVLFALVTDVIVGARLARVLGGPPRDLSDHVVVCGLGNIGYRVVERLASLKIPVVAAEISESTPFLSSVRRLGVAVVVGDARQAETLQALRVGAARCLVVVTNDDVANLGTALNARKLNPDIRVVLGLFDPDLAARVDRVFGFHISLSASALAAPAFVAASLGRRVIATIPVDEEDVLEVVQTPIAEGCQACGWSVSTLERDTGCRVLLLTTGEHQQWRPTGVTTIVPGQELVAVTTRVGLARLLARTEAGAGEDQVAGETSPPSPRVHRPE